jgi:cell division protease FtsH
MIKAILRLIFAAPESFSKDSQALSVVACHEAGHALVAELLEPDSVDLVTVLNHKSDTAGITATTRDKNYIYSKKLMENRLMCVLAGKAATEIMYGVVDTGVHSDLNIAFHIVQRFVEDYCTYGFGQSAFDRSPSGEVLERRDTRVVEEMESYYTQTKQLLVENRGKLEALTARLVEEKTLLGDQVQQVLKCA